MWPWQQLLDGWCASMRQVGPGCWPGSAGGFQVVAAYFYEQDPGDDQTEGQADQPAGRQNEGAARPACGQGQATSRGSQAASKDKGQATRQFPGPPAGDGSVVASTIPARTAVAASAAAARVQATGSDVRVGNKAMRP